jgi:hypothetical protein
MGRGCIDPRFLDLGTSWGWVVSFTPWPLFTRGKSSRYLFDRRLGLPQNRCERHGEEKIIAPNGTRTPTLGRPAHRQSLYRLSYPGSSLERKMYGPARGDEGWSPEIVKLERLTWLRHLGRTHETSPCRKPEGTRRAGRPSLWWLGSVGKALTILGVRG